MHQLNVLNFIFIALTLYSASCQPQDEDPEDLDPSRKHRHPAIIPNEKYSVSILPNNTGW